MKLHRSPIALLCAAAIGLGSLPASASVLYFDFNSNLVAPTASLFLFGNSGQQATISNLAGFNTTVTLSADGFFSQPISSTYQQSGTGTRNTGFKVESSSPVAGYFINRASASTDMTYLLDSAALGKNYYIASMGAGFGEGSQAAIHATQDNTAVTFTPKGGAPVNVTLNAGETYKYAGGSTDLTGSKVTSDKPVAVFSGHNCAQVLPGTQYCDTLIEQAIPTDKLSKRYLVTASKGAELSANHSDYVRIIGTAANTEVKIDGVVKATIGDGDFYEYALPLKKGALIETSNPVVVAQYLEGQESNGPTDPAMSYVPGSDTWLSKYRLATPSGGSAFAENYASLVIATSDLLSLDLDGVDVDTTGFSVIAGTSFSRGLVKLPDGLFDLTAANPFLVMLGGGASYDSYFTYGGSTFAPGISVVPPTDNGVPEPGTLMMIGGALAALAVVRRKAGKVRS